MRCGKNRHPTADKCPALGATCHKCNRKGHYSAQCRSRTVAAADEIVEIESSTEEAFLGAVTADREPPWKSTLTLEGKPLVFKLDTGAEVSAISEEAFRTIPGVKLSNSSIALYGPARQALDVLGQFTGKLKRRSTPTQQSSTLSVAYKPTSSAYQPSRG